VGERIRLEDEVAVSALDRLSPNRAKGTASLIAEQLRDLILDGSLQPGEQVNEVHVAARLEVSRGPVREAIQRLVQEGLLNQVRNRGTSVVLLDSADIADVYQGRLALEREAARIVFERNSEQLLDDLEAILVRMSRGLERGEWADVARTDLAFHQAIVDSVGSARMSRMFATLAAETLLCLQRFERIYDRREQVLEQHQRLADLLRAGESDAFLSEIDWHLKNSVIRLGCS
jgi:DNA-binding GntR family transcriptional regulator